MFKVKQANKTLQTNILFQITRNFDLLNFLPPIVVHLLTFIQARSLDNLSWDQTLNHNRSQ